MAYHNLFFIVTECIFIEGIYWEYMDMKKDKHWYLQSKQDLNYAIQQLIFDMRIKNNFNSPPHSNTKQNDLTQSTDLEKRQTTKQRCRSE